jgi:hypothetical protein
MKMEQIECSKTSAYKIQTPENYPEENIQHTEPGKSLKSKITLLLSHVYQEKRTAQLSFFFFFFFFQTKQLQIKFSWMN